MRVEARARKHQNAVYEMALQDMCDGSLYDGPAAAEGVQAAAPG
jgi:hypothetical protein